MSVQRIGIGYDVHAFAEGRRLVLGGVEVPHERGLLGHSDADVLVHAIMDIGKLFPDTDPSLAGVDSLVLLSRVAVLARERGYAVADVDSVVVLQAPRIAPHRELMRARIAEAIGVGIDSVGVKATTTEGLGFTGREEGVAAYAVALLERVEA
jgi:2-C-methyl-D-erythritol 2,4-cyclodiphosphate synthase